MRFRVWDVGLSVFDIGFRDGFSVLLWCGARWKLSRRNASSSASCCVTLCCGLLVAGHVTARHPLGVEGLG